MSLDKGRRRILAGLGASLLAPSAWAFEAPKPRPRPSFGVESVASRGLKRTSGPSGWLAVDLDTGAVLDAHDADGLYAPASVAKLPTAVYALERLGAGHRFRTTLAMRGRISGGRLEGDLILRGGGDPELDSDDLLPMVMALKAAGVTRVTGRFIVDCGEGDELVAIDPAQPEDASYNPAVSGLNLNFNRVRVEWPAKAASGDIKVTARAARLNPDVRRVRVHASAADGHPMFAHQMDGLDEVWSMADRALRREGGRWLPVRRPGQYAGDVFAVLAATQGIALPAPEIGRGEPGDVALHVHESRRLPSVLDEMLHYSTNLTAELVGRAASGVPGPLDRSAAAMNAWAAQFIGVPGAAGFGFANHSGLSVASRVSPGALVAFLVAAATRPRPDGVKPSDPRLPGGVAALLKPYNVAAKSVPLDYDRLTIAAKTGTMDYMRGLSGYVVTPGNRRLAFAVFSNDLDRRRGGVSRIDRGWMARARTFEKALIRNWVARADA